MQKGGNFTIGKTLRLTNVDKIKSPNILLTMSDGKVAYTIIDDEIKRGSKNPASSDAVYRAIRKLISPNRFSADNIYKIPGWFDVMNQANFTNKPLEIRSPDNAIKNKLETNASGDMVATVGTNKRLETNGDIVAYGDGSAPATSWWDAMPIATASILGGVKIGSGISVTADGTISASSGGSATWGGITGTLSDQTDLQNALDGKEPAFTKNSGFNKNLGTAAGTVAEGNHNHTGVYEPANANIQSHISDTTGNPHSITTSTIGAEPAFTKKTGFNKDFGTVAGTVAEGNHTHTWDAVMAVGNTTTRQLLVTTSSSSWTIRGATSGKTNYSGLYFNVDDARFVLRDSAGATQVLIDSIGYSYILSDLGVGTATIPAGVKLRVSGGDISCTGDVIAYAA